MKQLLLCLSVLTASFAQAQVLKMVKGSGNVITQERRVDNFRQISSSGSFNVVVTQGDNYAVKVEGEDNILEYVETEVKGNNLHIRTKGLSNLKTTRPVTVSVTSPHIEGLRISGSGNLHTTNQIKTDGQFTLSVSGSGNGEVNVRASRVEASVSGSGNIAIKGQTESFEGRVSGSGNIRARDLQSNETGITISGSGNAEVVAASKLNSRISGSGEVRYWGDAVVESRTSGSGKVRRQGNR